MAIKITKTSSQYQKELDEFIQQKDDFESILSTIQDKSSQQALLIQGQISTIEQNINAIEIEISKVETAEEKARKKSNWKKEKPMIDQVLDENFIGYIIPEDKFIYCRDYGKSQNNVQFNMANASRIIRLLNKMTGTTISSKDYNEVIDYIESRGRSFYTVTSSFNNAKWNESEVYNKMSVIKEHWIKPDFANADKYDKALDLLIFSVAGGKQENIEHIEKWIAYKYLNPGKNANIPNMDLGGNPGGNGKGRLVELLKTIFTPTCVVQAHRDELDKFNGNWEMAVILYYDEPEEKELAASKLKQATGAEDMRVEKKGIDATMADRNYNFIFLSNNEKGVVKLSGGSDGGEDRRYSVITTDIVLYDELISAGYTDTEARIWLDNLAQKLVKDKVNVSRWLAHLIQKYDAQNLSVLPALHGHDYHKRFDDQKDNITGAFDKILPVFQQNKVISINMLTELVKILTENPAHKAKNVGEKFITYLTRNKIDTEIKDQASIKITWRGEEQDRIQHKSITVKGAANLSFDYSHISKKKWVKGLKDVNMLTEELILL